jgi:hypothetical protein
VTWKEKQVDNLETGKLDARLEAAIPNGMDAALNDIAKELAGSRSPKMFRSKAARMLLAKGIRAHRAEQARRTKVSA